MAEDKLTRLKHIAPDKIERNPENPRLFFRDEELATLRSSIRTFGIQVPLTVFDNSRGGYTLIDGERRWRCALKLNLATVPAIIHPRPSALDNILMMFNIHALREQWNYFTIASKLPRVIELFEKKNHREPNEIELSELTGLTRGQIRRCRLMLDLPERFKTLLVEELELPKKKQILSEDFFIEMERSLKTVTARFPDFQNTLDDARDTLIKKYRTKTIGNITDFRKLSKIATSIDNLAVKRPQVERSLKTVFSDNSVGIQEVYSRQFELDYDIRKIALSASNLLEGLKGVSDSSLLDAYTTDLLRELRDEINHLLGER